MQLRKKYLAFAVFTLTTLAVLWFLPQPRWHISPSETQSENRYWWWIALAAFVIGGCFFEHLLFETFHRLDTRITPRKRAAIQITLVALIAAVSILTIVRLWR